MEIFESACTDRILNLPRRPAEWSVEDTERARDLLTAWLKTPGGSKRLNAIQARCLVEAADTGSLMAMVGAGAGKTLATYLLPEVLKAKRTLLLVPAKLKRQTYDTHREWSEHFRLTPLLGAEDTIPTTGPIMRVQSYEALSHINYASWLAEFEPDLIVADEAHFLAHLSSGRSKRVFRFIKTARKAGRRCVFVPLTGTIWRRHVREAAHIFEAALGADLSPLPTDYGTLEQWGLCLDEGVSHDVRYEPGPLLRLVPPSEAVETDWLPQVRRAVRRRIVDCPGVVATSESTVPIPCIIQVRPVVVPPVVSEAMGRLRTLWELPNGDDAGEGVQVWAHAREIACGFAYLADPPAPEPWRKARRAWNCFVREKIARPGKGGPLDTPLMVWLATEAGRFGSVPEFDTWRAIGPTFELKSTPDWLSDYLIRDAEEWALKSGGIVWVDHTRAADGEAADDSIGRGFTRIPYFGAGTKPSRSGPMALSRRAFGTGTEGLQKHYSEALFLLPPSSGAAMEQTLARLHRTGQPADLVTYHVYQHSLEAITALVTAQADARFMESTTGNPQRILGANFLDVDGSAYRPAEALTRLDPVDPMFGA